MWHVEPHCGAYSFGLVAPHTFSQGQQDALWHLQVGMFRQAAVAWKSFDMWHGAHCVAQVAVSLASSRCCSVAHHTVLTARSPRSQLVRDLQRGFAATCAYGRGCINASFVCAHIMSGMSVCIEPHVLPSTHRPIAAQTCSRNAIAAPHAPLFPHLIYALPPVPFHTIFISQQQPSDSRFTESLP